MSLVFSIRKAVRETITIQLKPPESIDGWNIAFRAKSNAVNPDATTATWLADDIDAATTVFPVNCVTGNPVYNVTGFPLYGPFKVRIDNEVIQVTDGVGFYSNGAINTTWTVERGVWGTTPAAHTKRARVTLWTVPQMLLDNGGHGGVTVQDATTGLVEIDFDASFTAERPVGTYFWNLVRTDSGFERVIAEGTLYLLPSATSAFEEPPLHNS